MTQGSGFRLHAPDDFPVPGLLSEFQDSLPAGLTKSNSEFASSQDKAQRVWIVDDERLIADSLTEILKRFGYDATAFYNGESAIESACSQCPDVVVADVIMPKLNGIATALHMRQLCPKIRVLLFSGQAGTADILKDARSQGYDFELLPKPVHPDELLKKLG